MMTLNSWCSEIRAVLPDGKTTNRAFLLHDGANGSVKPRHSRQALRPESVHAENGVLVTRFIDGSTLDDREFDSDCNQRLAELLIQLRDVREPLTGEMLFVCPFPLVREHAVDNLRLYRESHR